MKIKKLVTFCPCQSRNSLKSDHIIIDRDESFALKLALHLKAISFSQNLSPFVDSKSFPHSFSLNAFSIIVFHSLLEIRDKFSSKRGFVTFALLRDLESFSSILLLSPALRSIALSLFRKSRYPVFFHTVSVSIFATSHVREVVLGGGGGLEEAASSFHLVYRGTSIAAASRRLQFWSRRGEREGSFSHGFSSRHFRPTQPFFLLLNVPPPPRPSPLIAFIAPLSSDTFARKSFLIDNRRLATSVLGRMFFAKLRPDECRSRLRFPPLRREFTFTIESCWVMRGMGYPVLQRFAARSVYFHVHCSRNLVTKYSREREGERGRERELYTL